MEEYFSGVTKHDFVEFERQQRHILNELAMKRRQVAELKNELNGANLKIHEQTRLLASAKHSIEEQQHNLTLSLKNMRFLEDTLQSKRDYVSRTQLQHESAVAERESLRELLQKTELHNYNLTRELNELKSQHNCDVAYQKEFINENVKVREKIAQLGEEMQKFSIDQDKCLELTGKLEKAEELDKSVTFYREELYKYKHKYDNLEQKFIKSKATVEKLEQLSKKSHFPFHTLEEPQLIIINQWRKATDRLTEQCKHQQDLITNLTEKIKIESENNVKLCLKEVDLENEILKLKNEISLLSEKNKVLQKQQSRTATDTTAAEPEIKTEIIEILSGE